MAFEGAASTVVAQEFVLIDPNGVQVGEFGQDPFGRPGLLFNHNDVLTTDSFLSWTQAGAGTESLFLVGPEGVGQAGQPPSLILSRSPGQKVAALQSVNLVQLIAEASPPDATGTSISIDGVSHDVTTVANTETKFDSNGQARGRSYGIDFTEAYYNGPAFNTTVAPAVIVTTAAMAAGPVAGCWLDISYQIDVTTLIANQFVQAIVVINGVAQTPASAISTTPVNSRFQLEGRMTKPQAPGVAVTVTVNVLSSVAAAYQITAGAFLTNYLTVIFHK